MNRPQQYIFTIVSVLLGIAVGTILLGVFLPTSVTMLTVVPTNSVVGGLAVLLGVVAVSALRDQSTVSRSAGSLVEGLPPERPQQPPARTGAAFDTTVSEAARDVRVKQVDTAATVPRNRLRQRQSRLLNGTGV
jgi:hypothetical protein